MAFRFPVRDSDDKPKIRPCLVLDTHIRDGRKFAVLAYGTTADTNANRGYEVHIRDGLGLTLSGLRKPTRFVGARRIKVSLDHGAFVYNREGTPILGHLVGTAFERMNDVRARIHAFADMRRERFGRRQARRGRPPQQLSLF